MSSVLTNMSAMLDPWFELMGGKMQGILVLAVGAFVVFDALVIAILLLRRNKKTKAKKAAPVVIEQPAPAVQAQPVAPVIPMAAPAPQPQVIHKTVVQPERKHEQPATPAVTQQPVAPAPVMQPAPMMQHACPMMQQQAMPMMPSCPALMQQQQMMPACSMMQQPQMQGCPAMQQQMGYGFGQMFTPNFAQQMLASMLGLMNQQPVHITVNQAPTGEAVVQEQRPSQPMMSMQPQMQPQMQSQMQPMMNNPYQPQSPVQVTVNQAPQMDAMADQPMGRGRQIYVRPTSFDAMPNQPARPVYVRPGQGGYMDDQRRTVKIHQI